MSRKTLRIAIKNEKRGGESDMRRCLAHLLVLVLLLTALVGCGGVNDDDRQSGGDINTQITAKKVTPTLSNHSGLEHYLQAQYGDYSLSNYVFCDFDIDNEERLILSYNTEQVNDDGQEFVVQIMFADPRLWYTEMSTPQVQMPVIVNAVAETVEVFNHSNYDSVIKKLTFTTSNSSYTLYVSIIDNNILGPSENGMVQAIFMPWGDDRARGTVSQYYYVFADEKNEVIVPGTVDCYMYATVQDYKDALLNFSASEQGSLCEWYETKYEYDANGYLQKVSESCSMDGNSIGPDDLETTYQYEYEDMHCIRLTIDSVYWNNCEYQYIYSADGLLSEIVLTSDDNGSHAISVTYNADGSFSYTN